MCMYIYIYFFHILYKYIYIYINIYNIYALVLKNLAIWFELQKISKLF